MKNYIFVALGMLASGLIGYWLGQKHIKNRAEEELRQEIDEMKKHYKRRLEEMETSYKRQYEELNPSKIADPLLKDQSPGGQQRTMVTRMQEPTEEEEDIYEEDEADPAESQHPEEEECWGLPFVISEEEYSEEKIWYDKLDYEFYLGDQTLVNEVEEILLNWEDEIGVDGMLYLLDSDPGDIVYVRNDELKTDYSIEVKPGKAANLELVPKNEGEAASLRDD